MKFNRKILFCILVWSEMISDAHPLPRRSLLFFPPLNKPFSIFTIPPHEPPHKGGILSHVLQGGGIGIEIRPLAPLQGILDHAKKFIPGHGTVGKPSHERPDHNDDHNEPYHERPYKPQPLKDGEEDPQWEDIGEMSSTGEEEEYGEGVLQPRRTRPKRFVESRIYHVPLMFRSNGRADKVRIKGRWREKSN